jgi:hypothetical protein
MAIDKNVFDNYEVGSLYMFYKRIARVVGHSDCNRIKGIKKYGGKLASECIGCKGASHFKYNNGETHVTCAHNGGIPLVKMHKQVQKTNTRW